MYGITQDTPESTVSSPIPTGINQNVVLKEVKFDSINADKPPVLQYIFVDEAGRELRHIAWPVDEDRERTYATTSPRQHKRDNVKFGYVKGADITPDEAVAIAGQNFNIFQKHIITKFVSNEEITEAQKNVTDYNTFAESVVKLLTPEVTTNVKLRLKVILDYQEKYNVLPKFPPFIELMSVTPSSLQINPQYDKLKPSTVADDDPESFDTASFSTDVDDEHAF